MAILKDLIVNGISRFIGTAYASKFVTSNGTSSQFVKGDGSLDTTTGTNLTNLQTSYNQLYSYVTTQTGTINIGYSNLKTYTTSQIGTINTGYSNLKTYTTSQIGTINTGYSNLKTYTTTQIGTINTGYSNLKTYTTTQIGTINTGYSNLKTYTTTQIGTINTGYSNLKTYTTTQIGLLNNTFKLQSDYTYSSLSNENLLLAPNDSYNTAFGKLEKAIIDNEEVTAYALIDLNENIDELFQTMIDSGNAQIFQGTCTTAAATVVKLVDCPEFTADKLVKGAKIFVTFSATNTGAVGSLKLNVNSTGDKPMKKIYSNSLANLTHAGELIANQTYLFIYDGTNWVCMTLDYNTNTTYNNASLGQGYFTCTTAEATLAKAGTLQSGEGTYQLVKGGICCVKFTYKVLAGSTLNLGGKGAKAMYYRGVPITDNIINEGDIGIFIYSSTVNAYILIGVDRSSESSLPMAIPLIWDTESNIISASNWKVGDYGYDTTNSYLVKCVSASPLGLEPVTSYIHVKDSSNNSLWYWTTNTLYPISYLYEVVENNAYVTAMALQNLNNKINNILLRLDEIDSYLNINSTSNIYGLTRSLQNFINQNI